MYKFFQTWEKMTKITKLANINQWDYELKAYNEILLAEHRQWALLSSILLKHYCNTNSVKPQADNHHSEYVYFNCILIRKS